MRRSEKYYEQAARRLAKIRGKDPDELTFFGPAKFKRPRWQDFAEQLRAHDERDEALYGEDDVQADVKRESGRGGPQHPSLPPAR